MLGRVLVFLLLSAPCGVVAQTLPDVPNVVLEVRAANEGAHPMLWVWFHDDWRPICAAPCERTVPTGAWQFGLSDSREHWPSPVEGGAIEIRGSTALVVELASRHLERILGAIVGLVSLAGVGFGLFGVLNPVTGDVVDGLRLIGGSVSLALGIGGTATGLWLLGLADHARAERRSR